jgi:hypothetical protein
MYFMGRQEPVPPRGLMSTDPDDDPILEAQIEAEIARGDDAQVG